MDLSKLPKLAGEGEGAKSPQPPAPPDIPTARLAPVDYHRTRPEPAGLMEAWLSLGIGAILLLIQPNLLKYLFGVEVPTITTNAGQTVPYLQSVFFQSDLAVTAFALVLIVEGLIIAFTPHPALVLVALVFTILATLWNLLYLITTYSTYGLPLLSAFAVVFGGFIASYEWRVYKAAKG